MQDEENIPQTGPEAIVYALQHTSVDDLEARAKQMLAEGKKTKRPGAVALLHIVQGMRRNNQTPADYMISAVPVVPPAYRPFAAQGGSFIPGDANILYKDLFDVLGAYNEEREMFGDDLSGESRLALYDQIKSVYGYGEPIKPKTKAKEVKGFLQKLTGTTSKFGYVNRKLLSKTQDNTGRSTIIVDPEYGIDDIGIPEAMAFKMYAPYIQRRLKMMGMRDAQALKNVVDRTDDARRALEEEMKVRPVVYSRAPAWHAFSILGGRPRLVEGSAIKTNPYVAKGLGADYDGDQQIGSVLCRLNLKALGGTDTDFYKKIKNCVLQNPKHVLTYKCPSLENQPDIVNTMFTNNKININDGSVWINVDLADFPHGELNNVNKKNGYDIEFYNVPEGISVLAYDEETKTLKEAPVKYWSIHKSKEVEIVTLSGDSQIYTDDDPRAVFGIASDADSLTPQRFTPTEAIRRKVIVPKASNSMVEFNNQAPQYYDMLTNEVCWEKRNEFTVALDYDFGQVVGCLCGDGWVDNGEGHAPRTCLSDKEFDNANFILDYFRRTVLPGCTMSSVEQRETDGKFGTSVTHTYHHKNKGIVSKAIKELVGGERTSRSAGADTKRLPAWYAVANTDFLRGLINGLVATDGTICVSQATDKEKPQLMIAFSSISLRLVREAKNVLNMLGCRGTISFAKETVAGNDSWQLTISTTYAKMANLFANCCMKRKAENFINTPVSTEDTAVREDYVPFPECVWNIVKGYFPSLKVTPEYREAHPEISEEDWKIRKAKNVFATGLYDDRHAGYMTRAKARRVIDKLAKITSANRETYEAGLAFIATVEPGKKRQSKRTLTEEEAALVKDTVDCLYNPTVVTKDALRKKAHSAVDNSKVNSQRANLTEGNLETIKKPFDGKLFYDVFQEPILLEWISMVESPLQWVYIKSVEKTGKVETGYDLTVPGYETFTNSEGVVLSNTINVHVPASEAAVKEAYEIMMPSKTPFSNRDQDKLVPLPKQEQILGLYTAATAPETPPVNFATEDEALHAIRSGKVPLSANITINGQP